MKRYTIFNTYLRGSNQSPQATHALNNLWKASEKSSDKEAIAAFKDWAYNHEVEIMLQGHDHLAMEKLYTSLNNTSGILASKFNEPGNNFSCSCVSFVASERIVLANNFLRANRISPFNAKEKLSLALFVVVDDELTFRSLSQEETLIISSDLSLLKGNTLTADEIFIVSEIAFLPLAN